MRIFKILLYRTIIFLLKGTVLWIHPVKILQTYKTSTKNTQTRLQFVDNKHCCSSRDMIPRLANTLVSKNCFLIAFKIWWFLRSHIVKTIKSLCVMSFLCVKTKAVTTPGFMAGWCVGIAQTKTPVCRSASEIERIQKLQLLKHPDNYNLGPNLLTLP